MWPGEFGAHPRWTADHPLLGEVDRFRRGRHAGGGGRLQRCPGPGLRQAPHGQPDRPEAAAGHGGREPAGRGRALVRRRQRVLREGGAHPARCAPQRKRGSAPRITCRRSGAIASTAASPGPCPPPRRPSPCTGTSACSARPGWIRTGRPGPLAELDRWPSSSRWWRWSGTGKVQRLRFPELTPAEKEATEVQDRSRSGTCRASRAGGPPCGATGLARICGTATIPSPRTPRKTWPPSRGTAATPEKYGLDNVRGFGDSFGNFSSPQNAVPVRAGGHGAAGGLDVQLHRQVRPAPRVGGRPLPVRGPRAPAQRDHGRVRRAGHSQGLAASARGVRVHPLRQFAAGHGEADASASASSARWST